MLQADSRHFVVQRVNILHQNQVLPVQFAVNILSEILNPKQGLFRLSNNGYSLCIDPNSKRKPDFQAHFRYAGALLAKLLVEKVHLEVSLQKILIKQLLNLPIDIADYQDVNPQEARRLIGILQNQVQENCTFSVQGTDCQGNAQVIDLIEDGRNVNVENEQKQDYVYLVGKYRIIEETKEQSDAFLQGFYNVIDLQYIMDQKFTDFEFSLILNGNQSLDGALQIGNGPQINICKHDNKEDLPIGDPSSNTLLLPEYDNKEILREKLDQALEQNKTILNIS